MSTRKIKDAKDLTTNELIYFKGHAKAIYMSDGTTVEDAINNIEIGTVDPNKLIKITYSGFKSLRDNSQLTPGSFYRITDYVTTTTQSGTKSANHPFDVIVLALSENTLCEDAKAILHEGDTYFADSDLSAWNLKYCLDNDKTRFAWVDETNGKGVIYRMVDEKRNDCPYDFKNILFYNTTLTSDTTSDKYYYTFSYVVKGVLYDGTTERGVKYCSDNKINAYTVPGGLLYLNNIVLRNTEFGNCRYNIFGNGCCDNTFGNGCCGNTFKNSCFNNIFGNSCDNNTFGNDCYNNTFGNYCDNNTFGNSCDNNKFGDNLQNRSLNSDKTSITLNEEYYDDGSDQLVPIKHPDLSTQPSILPYKFMGQYVYEQLIPVNKGDRAVKNEFAVETPMIMSAGIFSVNSFKNINILVAKSNALLLDTASEMGGYINVKYTDGSVLSSSGGYYSSTSTSSSNNSSFDFGIMEDGTSYIYDNDTLTLSKNGEINDNSIPSQYKNSSKIIIDNNVTSIGNSAFYNCSSLTSVEIPNSVTSIGVNAFAYCRSLTSIEIPNSVTRIEEYVFGWCSSLTSVEIGNSVTSIGESAFYDCSSLTSVDIPNSVTSIGGNAFYGCSGLTSVEIPNSVTSIGYYAFYRCSSLTSIDIPNSVTSIGDKAFYGCSGLTSVVIGNSVTSIGNSAFEYCTNLTSIVVAPNNPKYDSRDNCNAIIESESNTLIAGCMNSAIPNSVTSIGDYAFCGCSRLKSVELPNSVTSIGSYAFEGCYGLTSVEIGNSVTSIGSYAFSGCTKVISITCEAIYPPVLSMDVFNGVFKSIPLYVPAESVEAYKSANNWNEFTNIQAINEL